MSDLILLIAIIIAALVYDFFNGFNDCANAIATTISTRALSPNKAIMMARTLNFVGALSHTAVATPVGKGILDPQQVSLVMVLVALIGASVWTAFASYSGIPVSVSHSLIGGLLGAGLMAAGLKIVLTKGIVKVVIAMVVSPILGFLGGLLLITVIFLGFQAFITSQDKYPFQTATDTLRCLDVFFSWDERCTECYGSYHHGSGKLWCISYF